MINPFEEEEKALDNLLDKSISEESKLMLDDAEREIRWKQRRIGKITSSALPDIMDLNKKGCIRSKKGIDYLLEKMHQIETGEDANFISAPAMRWGHEHEEEAHEYYRKVTGIDMKSGTYGFDDILFVDDVLDGFGDSPDGRTPDGKGIAEYKCPYNGANHLRNCALESFNDTNAYFWQVMGHLLDPKIEWCDFVSFDPRYPDGHQNKIKILRVYRKDVLPRLTFLQERLEMYINIVRSGDIETILNL